jgi:predicted ATPase/class 3 adenylate cyclase
MICPNCQFPNPDKANFCATCGTRLNQMQAPQGERKLLTVLFADVVGSTSIGERIDPEETSEIMNGALAFMNDAVAQHYGMVARLMGDGILAFFGVPLAHENDPELAVRAGLEILNSSDEYEKSIQQRFGFAFQVRVGINTGLVVVEIVGNQVRSEFTAMGDAVNVANRLQASASPGELLISHDTYRHVRGLFSVKPLTPLTLKGKSQPIRVYRVLGAREKVFRQPNRGVAGIETPMVGREAELRQLQDNLAEINGLQGVKARIVTVIGEAGVGKSRLLYEFSNWLDLQPDSPHIFRGRATEEMSHLPYALLRDVFSNEFEIKDNDDEALARQKLEDGIAELGHPESTGWAPFIGHIIGFNYTHSPHLQGILDDAQQVRERAFFAASQFFKAEMQSQPVLIFLEDIHWADDGSLDFFDYLIQDCLDFPLMVVCLARNTVFEKRPTWGSGRATHIRLVLNPLSDQDSQRLISEILSNAPEIPPDLLSLIVSRAEGNPFYVEEAIKMLIDDGVLVPEAERWQLRTERYIELKIPPTLTGVLQARLDRLPPQERVLLHRASVAGRIFWDDLALRMNDNGGDLKNDGGDQSAQILTNLQNRELIFRSPQSAFAGTSEYIFKHSVLRDVTYERLLKRLRRVYHLQVANWLCSSSGERVGEYAARIAEHFEYGELPAQAAVWYHRAARQAQDTYIPEMAERFYRQALELWAQLEEVSPEQLSLQVEAFNGLGQVLNWLGRYDKAAEAFQNMIATAEAMGDAVMLARGWHGMAEASIHSGDIRAAIRFAEREEEVAGQAGARLELCKALWMQAWGAFRIGEIETAHSLAERVSAYSQDLQDRGQLAHNLNLLGVLAATQGHFDEAITHFEGALDIFTTLGNRRRTMPLMNNLGVIRESLGDYQQAMIYYQQALHTAREIGNRDGEMVYLSNLGGSKVRLGEFESAESDLCQVIQMSATSGLDVLSSTYSFLAQAYLGQDKVSDALTAAIQSLEIARETASLEDLGVAWRSLGQIAAHTAEPLDLSRLSDIQKTQWHAEDCYQESNSIFTEIAREEERARTLREWAKLKMVNGDHLQGMRLWQQAREIFARLGAKSEVERMEAIHENQTF